MKPIKPIQRTAFLFEYHDKKILFTPAPLENGTVQKFSFEIVGDPALTKKLIDSCKTVKIKREDFFYAARGLFEKIETGFQLPNNDETGTLMKELTERFQKEYKEPPLFDVVAIDEMKPGCCFEATLCNSEFSEITGVGPSKQKAKLNALKQLYGID